MDSPWKTYAQPPDALEVFLESLIDYAGLFPPARLPLESALDQYVTHLATPELSRYLGCFVIPVGALPRAAAWLRQRGDSVSAAPRFSVLAGPEDEYGAVAEAVHEFETSQPGARVKMLELKTNASAVDGFASIQAFLDGIEATVGSHRSRREVFVEIDWRMELGSVMALLETRPGVGTKLRTGGITPNLVPPPAAVARFLETAARFGLPLKFTAGLHVPVPNDDPAVGARMHGFLNVMAAAMAAYRGPTSTEELVQMIEQLGYADFSFDDEGFRAGALRFSASEVQTLRQRIRGFGSCSFLEPLEHLAAHGVPWPLSSRLLNALPRSAEPLPRS